MDLGEARDPVSEYGSLDALFVRRLRPGVRSWPAEASLASSPVDGVVGQSGAIREGRILQAKGREYTVAELLDDDALAGRFLGGRFLTIYLAPRHYHRIHAPASGRLRQARHIPGRLLPVNAPAVRLVPRLFPRNERLVALLEPAAGDDSAAGADPVASADPAAGVTGVEGGAVAVVAVGAFNVGRISADFDAELVTNRRGARAETRLYHPPVEVTRGDPLMAFHLGSTVVLLFEAPVTLVGRLEPGAPIRLGEALTAG